MSVQVLNYAAKARRFLENTLIGNHERAGRHDDAKATRFLCNLIDKAVHFHLPDSGRILDDALKGIWGDEVRLPFPVVTVEYRATGEVLPGAVSVPERLAVACETTLDDMPWPLAPKMVSELWPEDRRCIAVFPLSGSGQGMWTIDAVAVALPIAPVVSMGAAGQAGYETERLPVYFRPRPDGKGFVLSAAGFVVQPNLMSALDRRFGDRAFLEMKADSAVEAGVVLGLVEALSCSNVTSEITQAPRAAKNARRIKRGKLPLYEMRTLVVVAGRHGGGTNGAGHHASPRQHLRRGHIRRLPDGRNTWVNACVVGNSSSGIVDKSYSVVGDDANIHAAKPMLSQ